jgi:hypothetical protein
LFICWYLHTCIGQSWRFGYLQHQNTHQIALSVYHGYCKLAQL